MKSEQKKAKEQNFPDLKLVSSTKKKLVVRNMGCQKCEQINWKF